jgi:16S rRNA (uracil1498-N3)-methyltransferase
LPITWSRKNIGVQYTPRSRRRRTGDDATAFYNPRVIPRVHAPDAHAPGDVLDVPADEAHWLRDVLRLDAGRPVRVFDGRGHEWDGVIAVCTKARVRVALEGARTVTPEPRIDYALAMPVLKGDAADAVVRDAVMMGVARIQPFVSARTEASRAAVQRGQRRARWQRVAIASAKQCGRATVPVVDEVVPFELIVATAADEARLLFVEPAITVATDVTATPPRRAAVIATGPEGGWAPDEVSAAMAAGWQAVRLGPRILRAETAPLVALATCQAVWKDL